MESNRFIVTVIAPDKRALLNLNEYGLNLFEESVRESEQRELTIDGLLTLEEIGELVADGYKVLVKEETSTRMRMRHKVIGFEEWLAGMKEEL